MSGSSNIGVVVDLPYLSSLALDVMRSKSTSGPAGLSTFEDDLLTLILKALIEWLYLI
jgi:hypothetical protein